MWNIVLKKWRIVWVFMLPILKKNLISGVAGAETINTENTVTSGEFKKQKVKELKQNWREKRMHGLSVREMPEKLDKDKTWQWLFKSDTFFLTYIIYLKNVSRIFYIIGN